MSEITVRTAPLKIALVDDSDLATAGLRTLLEPFAERVVLVEHREAIARPDTLDVVLYEPLGLCGTAESLLRDLQRNSEAQTAVFSWAEPAQLPLPTARPYLSKSVTASRLVVDLEDLVAGRFGGETIDQAGDATEPEPVPQDAAGATALPEAALKVLTARECDIVSLIVAGMSNREIGDELSLSINSVKTYIRTAYRKMGVQRRTQAMLWALEHGLGDRPEALVG
ncbi:MAG: response regulator transcription factor [Nocardioides sp.]|uniref:helix-turn-helix transcriptional regulator n=1 Tax=Nocardioides sp. TaxID=35761 RepID=UPI00239AF9FA|nr:response regulator transcription factor [Nocardioides sp.]MDE0779008.1 response regulator transcription factor [Nocardioides sp.]